MLDDQFHDRLCDSLDNLSAPALPGSVAVLKTGARFGDDLADALAHFGIT